MKSCLECEEKIIGREDKSFVATAVVMPTITKSIKIGTNFMRNINNKLRKNYHSILLNTEGKSKPSS
jgi:hypothetical protein